MKCQVIRIPKGRGRFRTIYNPDRELRNAIRKQWTIVRDAMMSLCDFRVCHGFMPSRSPATNASYHIGYAYTLSMDLRDFFDTVTADMLSDALPQHVLDVCIYDGAARQGLPTSPALANIAGRKMDASIKAVTSQQEIAYTRYADDLTISGNSLESILSMRDAVCDIVESHGFVVNHKKTHIQHAKGGRRVITGLAVDDTQGVYIPRKVRRKARAARHQQHYGSAAGLLGWAGSPGFTCPICWSRRGHGGMYGVTSHFRGNHPQLWLDEGRRIKGNPQVTGHYGWRMQETFVVAYLESLVDSRGGIADYARLYEEIRNQYVAYSLGCQ